MIFYVLGVLSGLVGIGALIPYIIDTIKGTTKPERAAFLIWSVLGGIAFASQYASGAGASLWMVGLQTIGVVIVFALSIKHGEGGIVKRDMIALVLAALGLVLWYFTSRAYYALFITILVDAIGAVLVLFKAYYDPESETLSTWIFSGLSGLLALVSVGKLDWILMAYPMYIFLINFCTTTAILMGKRRLKS